MEHVIAIDIDGRRWSVHVDGGTASLAVGPPGGRRGSEPDRAVAVPVGDLLHAVGSAWQDDVGPPGRRWSPDADDAFEEALDDLWRRGPDPDDTGWDDEDPSPYAAAPPPRLPPSPPEPARKGAPWSEEEEERLRTLWLAADPCAERDAVLATVAAALERQVASIRGRLKKVGCHDAFPGVTLEGAREVAVRLAAERADGTVPGGGPAPVPVP